MRRQCRRTASAGSRLRAPPRLPAQGQRRLERPEVAAAGAPAARCCLPPSKAACLSKSRFFTSFFFLFHLLFFLRHHRGCSPFPLPPARPSPAVRCRGGPGEAGGCNLPAGQGRPPAGGRSGAAAAIGRGAERHLLGSLMRVTPGLGGDI